MIAAVTAINFRGIKESAGFNVVCTLIEMAGLFLVVVIGTTFLIDGGGDVGRALEFNDDATPALLMVAGASIAFYALIGFEDAVNVAEETQDATHSFPRTLFTGLGIAGFIYLLVDAGRRHDRAREHARGLRRPAARGRHAGPRSPSTARCSPRSRCSRSSTAAC